MTDIHPHQEQLFDTGESDDDARWKLDERTRRTGRRGLAAVRDELEKHPAPVFERKRRRPVPEKEHRSTAYVSKGYRNAA